MQALLERLLGDFAFAIWDGRQRRLFCARDHFGVKPFYYARVPGALVFSNTLDCVRLHPGVRDALNELAVGDFLLFGVNQDPATTVFADIRRVPPAHSLSCVEGQVHSRRYWTLPGDSGIRYRRPIEYVERFRELLRAAVRDRLRTTRIGVWMSGGLDSTSVAATAAQVLREDGRASRDLHAQTIVYDTLIADRERTHALAAARAMDIGISWFAADACRPFDGWDRGAVHMPEPVDDPFFLLRSRQLEGTTPRSRVLLCGEGADETLWRSDVLDLAGRMPPRELAAGLARSLLVHRRRPALGLRALLFRTGRPAPGAYPPWLEGGFERRAGLRERWERFARPALAPHHLRPEAFRKLESAVWPAYFESWDAGSIGVAVEGRYPFLDVRLVGYLLGIPPIPWCVDKLLLREAMRDLLPDAIRLRPKTPLNGDRLRAHLRRAGGRRLPRFSPAAGSERFIDWSAVPPLATMAGSRDSWLTARALCFNQWLKRLDTVTRSDKEAASVEHSDEVPGWHTAQEDIRETGAGGVRGHS